MNTTEIGRKLRAEDPVCHACFGRVFADRSFGLTNIERGKAIRIVLALEDDVPYEPPEEPCWVCEGEADKYAIWAERVVNALDGIEFDTYQVGTRVPALIEENDRLFREVADLPPDIGERFKSDMNREVGKLVGSRTGSTVDFDRPDVLALLDIERQAVEIQINPAFLYGRYQKLKRGIPQTEWPCNDCGGSGKQLGAEGEEACTGCNGTGFRYPTSVEQLTVPPVVEAMDGTGGVFHGAGREDVDARMLGSGRPFVIEIKNPRNRFPDLDGIASEINRSADGAVAVSELAFATHEMVERVKGLPASKTYLIEIRFSDPVTDDELQSALDDLDGSTIRQRTPERVAHRRTDRMRTRTVYEIEGEVLDPTRCEIRVRTEGGLYVKELVSGDGSRTEPSLSGLLGVEATVAALDVLDVEGETERFATDEYLLERPE